MKYTTIIIFAALLCGRLTAQTGSWNPTGADTSYPRTLLHKTEIPAIRTLLSDQPFFDLYSGVYSNANATVPAGNTTDAERLSRSHIAKNAAFIALMERKVEGGSVTTLTQTEIDALVAKSIGILEGINTSVSNLIDYDSWQWRGKELIDYAIAYDLLRGTIGDSPSLATAESKIQEFAGNLYTQSTISFFGFIFFATVKNNHAIKTAAAFGIAAVVINDATSTNPNEYPVNWINTAMWNIDNVFFRDALRMTEPGQMYGYAESPYYLRYAAHNFLPFFRALGYFLPDGNYDFSYSGNTNTIRHPFYDPAYDSLYQWAVQIRMPDGRMPILEDTYVNKIFPDLALTGKQQFLYKAYYTRMPFSQTLGSHLVNANADIRANFIAAGLSPQHIDEPLFLSLPNSGNLIFRSSTDSASHYLHVNAKHGLALNSSGGHNQGDASSFLLYDDGYVMALDPGYVKYNRRGEVGTALQHNLILVDGSGPLIGQPGQPNDAQAYIQNERSTDIFDYAEVSTSYNGADILRTFLHIDHSYFIIADFVNSASTHNYQWRLNGNGIAGGDPNSDGSYTPDYSNNRGTWTYKDVSMLAHTIAAGGGTYTTDTQPHEVSYDVTANHSVLQLEKSSVQDAAFLTVLKTYNSTAPSVTTVSTAPAALLSVDNGSTTDFLMADDNGLADSITAAVSGLDYTISTDAPFMFVRKSTSKLAALEHLFAQDAALLQLGGDFSIEADSPADVSITGYFLPDSINGVVHETCFLEFSLSGCAIDTVTGTSIASFTRLSNNRVRVEFSGEGTFHLTTTTILSSVLSADKVHYISIPVEPPAGFTVPGAIGGAAPFFMSGNGELYAPAWGLSTLTMNQAHGYKFYNSSEFSIIYQGNPLNGGYSLALPESTITLIGYPYTVSQAAADLFGSYPAITYADDDDGNLYIPALGIYTLTLEPGGGYRVYSDALISNFTFSPLADNMQKFTPTVKTNYTEVEGIQKTGNPYPVILSSITDMRRLPEYPLTIKLYDEGQLVGGVIIQDTTAAVPVIAWLGDEQLGIKGAKSGNGISLKIFYDNVEIPAGISFSEGGTYGSGLYTVCSINIENTLPADYSLSQNFPNPFNPSTVIEFTLPEQTYVELGIYNILGERVALPVKAQYGAGRYKVDFSAAGLPSGVYFYRLDTDSFSETKKMLLLR